MSVTTDLAVLQVMAKKGALASITIATLMGLTVFQITARLKGMQGRGFLARDKEGLWLVAPQGAAELANPSPSVSGVSKTMRIMDSTGSHSGAPDDTNVDRLRLRGDDWAPSQEQFDGASDRLPHVKRQLESFRTEPMKFRREIMALVAEEEHCRATIKRPRKGKWYSRSIRNSNHTQTLYIAPDTREYVMATSHETADLIIEYQDRTVPPSRLRLFSTSSAARTARKTTNVAAEQEERAAAKAQEARNERIIKEEAERAIAAEKEAEQIRQRAQRSGTKGQRSSKAGKARLHSGRDRTRTAPPERRAKKARR